MKRINRLPVFSRLVAAAVLWLAAGSEARAQWSLTQVYLPVTEHFSSFTAPSTWATANPAANQLDSDIWATLQSSATGSAASVFGLNYILGQGINTGGATNSGVYAFDTGTGVRGIGPQASDTTWSPGSLTVKLRNDTGLEIQHLRVQWSYLIYNDQPGRRDSQLLVSATDANGSYLAPFGGEVLSSDVPQTVLSWLVIPKDVTLNASIPNGGNYYLRWSFADLAGAAGSGVNRDKVGIADLQVTGIVLVGDYNNDGTVNAADYVLWRKSPSTYGGDPAGYTTWRAHFGQPPGSGAGAIANAAVPEPATLVLLILATAGWCLRRKRAA